MYAIPRFNKYMQKKTCIADIIFFTWSLHILVYITIISPKHKTTSFKWFSIQHIQLSKLERLLKLRWLWILVAWTNGKLVGLLLACRPREMYFCTQTNGPTKGNRAIGSRYKIFCLFGIYVSSFLFISGQWTSVVLL